MTIYIDENLPPSIAVGLDALQKHRNDEYAEPIEVKTLKEVYGQGTDDVDWIPLLGKSESCVITNDIHILKRPHERSVFETHKVGVFIIQPPKGTGLGAWGLIKLIVNHWPEICKKSLEEKKSFSYRISPRAGIKRI